MLRDLLVGLKIPDLARSADFGQIPDLTQQMADASVLRPGDLLSSYQGQMDSIRTALQRHQRLGQSLNWADLPTGS